MINATKDKLNFNNFNEKVVNGIEIYSISNVAFNIYKNNAKRDTNISRDVLERKLTAMILSNNIHTKLNGKYVYRFSGFAMIVNEDSKKIETISWIKDTHASTRITKEMRNNLRKNLKLLGLNSKGNNYSKRG